MNEVFLPFRHGGDKAPPITRVRSTLIVSGIQAFRARGLYERYASLLDAAARGELLSLIAGKWIPIELGLAHYRAAHRLELDVEAIDGIGAEVAERINKSALSIMVKMSREAGVTPWTALASAHRVTEINWQGSDVRVVKLGPKDARYEWYGQPCAEVPYFVTSFGGYLRAMASLFCTRAYTHVLRDRCSATSIAYRLSWV